MNRTKKTLTYVIVPIANQSITKGQAGNSNVFIDKCLFYYKIASYLAEKVTQEFLRARWNFRNLKFKFGLNRNHRANLK